MDRVTMAFGPISDVVGFTHRDGQTYLSLLEDMRTAYNDLVAQYTQLPTYIRNMQADWQAAFTAFQTAVETPVDEYAALVASLEAMIVEASAYVTQATDYATTTTPSGTPNPDETTDTDYTTIA